MGIGSGDARGESAEKLGGTAAARLQTSGEKTAVIDLSGLGYDAERTARVALGAALEGAEKTDQARQAYHEAVLIRPLDWEFLAKYLRFLSRHYPCRGKIIA